MLVLLNSMPRFSIICRHEDFGSMKQNDSSSFVSNYCNWASNVVLCI